MKTKPKKKKIQNYPVAIKIPLRVEQKVRLEDRAHSESKCTATLGRELLLAGLDAGQ